MALADRAEALARDLLPDGRSERGGQEWRAGSLAGDAGRSLVVTVRGERAGRWMDYASGEHGDAIDLIAEARTGGDRGAACRWARDWLGMPSVTTARPRTLQAPPDVHRWTTERAVSLWWESARPIAGTVAERYLRDARGLDLTEWPGDLGWRPAYHASASLYLPALVALVRAPDGAPVAVQVTRLRPDGTGKADVSPARRSYGPARGGAVRLVEARPGELLFLAEGVEDALAVLALLPGAVAWATLGTSGLRTVEIPPEIRDVRIAADADDPGRRAAQLLADRLIRERRDVRIVYPPAGAKDWNDALRAVTA